MILGFGIFLGIIALLFSLFSGIMLHPDCARLYHSCQFNHRTTLIFFSLIISLILLYYAITLIRQKTFTVTLIIFLLLSLSLGYYLAERSKKAEIRDEKRDIDMLLIRGALHEYHTKNNTYPDNIKNLSYKDPKTKKPYQYVKQGPDQYELCPKYERMDDIKILNNFDCYNFFFRTEQNEIVSGRFTVMPDF